MNGNFAIIDFSKIKGEGEDPHEGLVKLDAEGRPLGVHTLDVVAIKKLEDRGTPILVHNLRIETKDELGSTTSKRSINGFAYSSRNAGITRWTIGDVAFWSEGEDNIVTFGRA